MKNIRYILFSLILIALVFVVIKSPKNYSVSTSEINLSPEVNSKQLCYIWNTEAGDKAMLSMDIRGEDVIGEFYYLPAEKDSKTGIFKGKTISFNSDPNKWGVNAFWNAQGEGTTVMEELFIVVDKSIAHPGFGIMKDRGDGVYVYADPEHIYYDLNLQQTDCGDEAMD